MSKPKSLMFFPFNGLLLVFVLLCSVFQTIYSTQESHNGFILKLIYRDSPESPLYRPNQTEDKRIQRLIQISKFRYESISTTKKNLSSLVLQARDMVHPSIHRQKFLYMVQLGIGRFHGSSPYLTYYLVLDTGSDITWTQCEGCRPCFPQRDPYFPRSRSQTYNPFPCNKCPPTTRCQVDHCTFSRAYAEGSYINGIMARETFTFASDRGVKTFPLAFGCGIDMHNVSLGRNPSNVISGILGLSQGSLSFAKQLKTHGLGTFSYCLQPLSAPPHAAPMFLRFADHISRVPGMVYTPLRVVANKPHYYVNLLHLSVAGIRLNISYDVFAVKPDGSGGNVMDSGAALSHIVSEAFEVLLDSIATYIKSNNRNLERVPGYGGFEACWKGPSDPSQVNLPSVTFHFQNADMIVQPDSVFFISQTHKLYCLAILRGSPGLNGVSSIGAYQQGNQRIVYDLNRNTLIFKAADCSQSN